MTTTVNVNLPVKVLLVNIRMIFVVFGNFAKKFPQMIACWNGNALKIIFSVALAVAIKSSSIFFCASIIFFFSSAVSFLPASALFGPGFGGLFGDGTALFVSKLPVFWALVFWEESVSDELTSAVVVGALI